MPAHYDIQRYAQFMDARFPGDDPVERMRSELETFEGFQIDPAELEELKGLLLKAEQEKRGFTESLAFEVGYAYSAASIALELEGDLSKGAIQAAVQMLQTQWSRNRGEEAVTNAITRLARNGASAALRGELLSVADELTAKNHDRASAAILTVLIETATGEPKDLAMLFVKRADLRAKANTMDLRDRDLEIALALAPGDPHIESLLGADWIEQDEYLASAATLMEHVLSLEPDNASVKDSLGWDYVKTGKLEQGVALLVQAVAARPDDPATLLHLAHAHRLAGDIELAKQELAKALSRDPNDHVYGLIESERDILTPASDKEPSEQESAAAIARAMEETDFYSSKAVSTDAVGLAISGFDPVAYFSRQQAVLGKGEYFTLWKGGLWLFASADDRARFVQHPDRYTPAFGGFCSYCLWVGNKYHGNPQVWAVYEGTLYLHSSKENLANWEESPDYFIEDAHIRWSKVDDEDVTPAASTRLSDEVSKLLETRRRLSALIRTTTEHRQSGDKTGALASVTEAYGLVQAEVAKAHPKVDENLATIAGNLAYEMLFTGDYAKALSLAEQGLDLDPQLIWIETNRAEALMFLGRIAEARAIYLQYRHFVLSDGKQWEDDVQSDFALLRAAGHTSPLMDEIEKAFQSPRQ
jgi:tetratricopeptide (TPR) repeat protein